MMSNRHFNPASLYGANMRAASDPTKGLIVVGLVLGFIGYIQFFRAQWARRFAKRGAGGEGGYGGDSSGGDGGDACGDGGGDGGGCGGD